ncbi:MAG: racX [Anaerocolumna sp.]|jgi:aspartate racemase|nr:racX [Anaerocolumna sp.]
MKDKIIGILAGMGPRSTAPFIDLVIDECQLQYGAKYDEEFPKIMIYSLPTPFYIDRPINHDLMKETIIQGLKQLEAAGASFIGMPCNSAHVYYEELKSAIDIPLLHIVDETIKKLPETPQRVSLFSTKTTFESGIYQSGIEQSGHEFVFKEKWQYELNVLIKGIKSDKEDPENVKLWKRLLEEVKGESIQHIILGCTDLNVVVVKTPEAINIIDSAKCLSEAVVRQYLNTDC